MKASEAKKLSSKTIKDKEVKQKSIKLKFDADTVELSKVYLKPIFQSIRYYC